MNPMFSITNLEESEAIDLLHSLLSQGVPPTALARAFAIDPDFVRGIAEQVRIRQYGTAELAEVMNWLQWEAIDEAVDLLHTGSPANRIRAVAMILPRSVTAASKQDPQSFVQMRDSLTELFERQKETPLITEQSPGEFVVGDAS